MVDKDSDGLFGPAWSHFRRFVEAVFAALIFANTSGLTSDLNVHYHQIQTCALLL